MFNRDKIKIIENTSETENITITEEGNIKLTFPTWLGIILIVFFVLCLVVLLFSLTRNTKTSPTSINLSDLKMLPKTEAKIKATTSIETYFQAEHFSPFVMGQLLEECAQKNVEELSKNGTVTKFYTSENREQAAYYLYKNGSQTQFLFAFLDAPIVQKITPLKKRVYELETLTLPKNMLEIALEKEAKDLIDPAILEQIEQTLSWSIGLRNLQKGDIIHLLWGYDEWHFVDTIQQKNETPKLEALALHAQNLDTVLYAFNYQINNKYAFYDLEARPWKRQFLHSPVKYSRVSSRFNLSRLHPILKKIKPHRGTDFAAPEGLEVLALADGIVKECRLKGANGNYVRIEHDSIYKTAYLHLSKFARGIEVGDFVRQGQTIGYVGETGSATGPHVCLRFWRRDVQRDFVKSFPYLPKPAPLSFQERQPFLEKRDSLLTLFPN